MAAQNPVRFVAPLALIAALLSVVVVVQASRPGSAGSSTATETVGRPTPTARRRGKRRKAYVVRSGDTLTMIAERVGLPLEQLERLNPDLDAQALRVGQRLRLGP